MIVIACPGQGSQTPGFLDPWLESNSARDFLVRASDYAEVDLLAHGTTSDADTIRDTRIAQPLIVAASMLTWRELNARTSLTGVGVAGHSVGEFAAAYAAGVLNEQAALQLVGVRGQAMAQAAAQFTTGMSAVVGGLESDVLDALNRFELTPANRNGANQIVAAGLLPNLEALSSEAPRGSRVISLQVAGAFHTEYMQPAIPALTAVAESVTVSDPLRPLWTNADGSLVTTGTHALQLLVSQIANPVRWDLCMESFVAAGITGFIELAPAGTLTGIAKRALKGIPSVAVKTPADLDAAVELITSQGVAA